MPPLDCRQLNILILRVAKGDTSALDEIFTCYGKRMVALARGIVRSQADAEDVVSESFVKLVKGASTFKEGNGYGFLMRIVRNAALDFLRRNNRRAVENIDDFFSLTDERYSPEKREDALLLEGAILSLPPLEKKMIYYRYYLDLTVREIAREEKMSKSSVERAVSRAEELVKKALQAGQTEGESR